MSDVGVQHIIRALDTNTTLKEILLHGNKFFLSRKHVAELDSFLVDLVKSKNITTGCEHVPVSTDRPTYIEIGNLQPMHVIKFPEVKSPKIIKVHSFAQSLQKNYGEESTWLKKASREDLKVPGAHVFKINQLFSKGKIQRLIGISPILF